MGAFPTTNRQLQGRFGLRCSLLICLAFILHALAMAGGMHTSSLSHEAGLFSGGHAPVVGDVIASDQHAGCWVTRPMLSRT